MKERSTMQVEISGHTDAVGPEAYNLGLSLRRAMSVSRYLVENGIASDQVVVNFFGETKLIDTSNTKEGNRKNRRVEFKILKM
jgi:outer membrane protein OmpA-like peptidoglycan-associated protein